jgi:hypothetical protein
MATFSIQAREIPRLRLPASVAKSAPDEREKPAGFARNDNRDAMLLERRVPAGEFVLRLPHRKTPPGWRRYKSCEADGQNGGQFSGAPVCTRLTPDHAKYVCRVSAAADCAL